MRPCAYCWSQSEAGHAYLTLRDETDPWCFQLGFSTEMYFSRELPHSVMWMLRAPLTGVTARVQNKMYHRGDLLPEVQGSRLAYVI
jgi:hypothetical protein